MAPAGAADPPVVACARARRARACRLSTSAPALACGRDARRHRRRRLDRRWRLARSLPAARSRIGVRARRSALHARREVRERLRRLLRDTPAVRSARAHRDERSRTLGDLLLLAARCASCCGAEAGRRRARAASGSGLAGHTARPLGRHRHRGGDPRGRARVARWARISARPAAGSAGGRRRRGGGRRRGVGGRRPPRAPPPAGVGTAARHGLVHWQSWNLAHVATGPTDVGFVWDAQYGGLKWSGHPTTVLQVQSARPPAYLRATVLDDFIGDAWSVGLPRAADSLEPAAAHRPRNQTLETVTVEGLADNHLVGGSIPVRFEAGSGAPLFRSG